MTDELAFLDATACGALVAAGEVSVTGPLPRTCAPSAPESTRGARKNA
ncbi:MAG: hypothetical protein ACRDZV_03830 [Acidimicrobiia bacterium]